MSNEEYQVVNGWLVMAVNSCTCAGGTAESSYAHEPYCGWEPIDKIEELRKVYNKLARVRELAVEASETHSPSEDFDDEWLRGWYASQRDSGRSLVEFIDMEEE